MKKSTLLVTHSWPPDTCVGAVRPVNIVREIMVHGRKTAVLTAEPRYYCLRHKTDVGDAIADQVIRTRCLPHPLEWYRTLKG